MENIMSTSGNFLGSTTLPTTTVSFKQLVKKKGDGSKEDLVLIIHLDNFLI